MFRRALVIVAAAALVAAQAGCRSQCGDRRPGWFTSNTKGDVPCQTVGRNGGCFDAATGQPVPCPPGAPTGVIPGGTYPVGPIVPGGPRPDELHMPSPTDMIRPPAIPFPAPAPPNDALLPLPTSPGTPVKSGSKN